MTWEKVREQQWNSRTLHFTCATDIAPLKSDGAKIFWPSSSVENLQILEVVADLEALTVTNMGKFALMVSL